MLFYQYLHNNSEAVTLEAIDKPDKTFDSLLEPLQEGLAHEQYVTSLIHEIYAAGQQRARFPHHPVPGLVCQGAGGGREERGWI